MVTINSHLDNDKLQLVLQVLHKAGWSPDRQVDTTDLCQRMRQKEWPESSFFPLALTTIASLYDLTISGEPFKHRDLKFYGRWVEYSCWIARHWYTEKGIGLFPLADAVEYGLYLGSNGCVYMDPELGPIDLIGRDLFEGIYNYLHHTYIERIYVENYQY